MLTSIVRGSSRAALLTRVRLMDVGGLGGTATSLARVSEFENRLSNFARSQNDRFDFIVSGVVSTSEPSVQARQQGPADSSPICRIGILPVSVNAFQNMAFRHGAILLFP